MYDVQTLRRNEFPITQEFIYFHNAGVAPLPTRTKNKMQWSVHTGLTVEQTDSLVFIMKMPMSARYGRRFPTTGGYGRQ
jgi:hypothetical protein